MSPLKAKPIETMNC